MWLVFSWARRIEVFGKEKRKRGGGGVYSGKYSGGGLRGTFGEGAAGGRFAEMGRCGAAWVDGEGVKGELAGRFSWIRF